MRKTASSVTALRSVGTTLNGIHLFRRIASEGLIHLPHVVAKRERYLTDRTSMSKRTFAIDMDSIKSEPSSSGSSSAASSLPPATAYPSLPVVERRRSARNNASAL